MRRITVINGPNLNLLGRREQHVYGDRTLLDIENLLREKCEKQKLELEFIQSNDESEIIEALHKASSADGVIINPAAFSHYSIAVRDALANLDIPVVEVHISNIHAREDFRKRCLTAEVVTGQICGLGISGYVLALDFLLQEVGL